MSEKEKMGKNEKKASSNSLKTMQEFKKQKIFWFDTSCEVAKKAQVKIVYDPREGKGFDQFFQKQHFVHAMICHHVRECEHLENTSRFVLFENRKICCLILINMLQKMYGTIGF